MNYAEKYKEMLDLAYNEKLQEIQRRMPQSIHRWVTTAQASAESLTLKVLATTLHELAEKRHIADRESQIGTPCLLYTKEGKMVVLEKRDANDPYQWVVILIIDGESTYYPYKYYETAKKCWKEEIKVGK